MASPQATELYTEMIMKVRDSTASGFSSMRSHAEGATKSLAGLKSGLDGISSFAIGNIIGGLGINAISDAVSGLKNFGESLTQQNSIMEQVHQTFTTLYSGNTNDADQAINYLNQFALKAPFTRQAVYQAGTQIAAIGGDITEVMPSLGNLAAAMHETLPRAAQALTDAFEGRFYMMQRDLHVTKAQLQDFGLVVDNTGHVLQSSLLPAVEAYVKAVGFAGNGQDGTSAMSRQLLTFQGGLSNLTDSLQQAEIALGNPIFRVVESNVLEFVKLLRNSLITGTGSATTTLDEFLGRLGSYGANVAQVMFAFIRVGAEELPKFVAGIKSAFNKVEPIFSAVVSQIQQFAKQIGEAFHQVGGDVLIGVFSHIGISIGMVVGEIALSISRFIIIYSLLGTAIKAILPIIQPVLTLMEQLFLKAFAVAITEINKLSVVIKGAFGGINTSEISKLATNIAGALGPAIVSVSTLLKNAFVTVVPIILHLGQTIFSIAQSLYNQLRPAVTEVFGLMLTSIRSVANALASMSSGSGISVLTASLRALAAVVGSTLVVGLHAISGVLLLIQHNSGALIAILALLAAAFRTQLAASITESIGAFSRWVQGVKESIAAAQAQKAIQGSMIGMSAAETTARIADINAQIAATEAKIVADKASGGAMQDQLKATLEAQKNNLAYTQTVNDQTVAQEANFRAAERAAVAAKASADATAAAAEVTADAARVNLAFAESNERVTKAIMGAMVAAGRLSVADQAMYESILEATTIIAELNVELAEFDELTTAGAASAAGLAVAEASTTVATVGFGAALAAAAGAAWALVTALAPIVLPIIAISAAITIGSLIYRSYSKQIDALIQVITGPFIMALKAIGSAIAAVGGAIGVFLSGPGAKFMSFFGSQTSSAIGRWSNEIKSGMANATGSNNESNNPKLQIANSNSFAPIISAFKSAWGSVSSFYVATLQGMFLEFKGFWEESASAAIGGISIIVDIITGHFSRIPEDFKNTVGGMLVGFIDFSGGTLSILTTMGVGIINIFINIKNGIRGAIEGVATIIEDVVKGIVIAFVFVGVMIGESIKKGIAVAINAIVSGLVTMKKDLSSIGDIQLPSWMGGHKITLGQDFAKGIPGGTNSNPMQNESWTNVIKDSSHEAGKLSSTMDTLDKNFNSALGSQTKAISLNNTLLAEANVLSKMKKAVVDNAGTMAADTSGKTVGSSMTNNSDPIVAELAREYNANKGNNAEQSRLWTMMLDEQMHTVQITNAQLALTKTRDPEKLAANLKTMYDQTANKLFEAQKTSNQQLSNNQTVKLSSNLRDISQGQDFLKTLSQQAKNLLASSDYNPTLAAKAEATLQADSNLQIHAQIWGGWNAQQSDAVRASESRAVQGTILQLRAGLDLYNKKVKDAEDYVIKPGVSNPQLISDMKGNVDTLYKAYLSAQDLVNKEKLNDHGHANPADQQAAQLAETNYKQSVATRDKFLDSLTGNTAESNKWLIAILGGLKGPFLEALKKSDPGPYRDIATGNKPNPKDLAAANTINDVQANVANLKTTLDDTHNLFKADVAQGADAAKKNADIGAWVKAYNQYTGFGELTPLNKQLGTEKAGSSQWLETWSAINKLTSQIHELSVAPLMVMGKEDWTATRSKLIADQNDHASSSQLGSDIYQMFQAGKFSMGITGTPTAQQTAEINQKIANVQIPYFKNLVTTGNTQLSQSINSNADQKAIMTEQNAILANIQKEFPKATKDTPQYAAEQIALQKQITLFNKEYYGNAETLAKQTLSTDMSSNSDQKTIMKDINAIYQNAVKAGDKTANSVRLVEESAFWKQQESSDLATFQNDLSSNATWATIQKDIAKIAGDMGGVKGISQAAIDAEKRKLTTQYYKGVETQATSQFSNDVQSNAPEATVLNDMKAIMNALRGEGLTATQLLTEQLKLNKQYYGTKLTNDQNQFNTDLTNNATYQTLLNDLVTNVKDMKGEGKTQADINAYLDKTQKQIDAQQRQNRTAYDFGTQNTTPAAVKQASFGDVDVSFGLVGQSSQMQIIRRLEEALQEARQQNLQLQQVVAALSNQDKTMGDVKDEVKKLTGDGVNKIVNAVKGNKQIGNPQKGEGSQKNIAYG